MAVYDYMCHECGQIREVHHKMDDKPVITCDLCGRQMFKTFTKPADVHYKGDWFKNKGKY